jgi:hypothetical protein
VESDDRSGPGKSETVVGDIETLELLEAAGFTGEDYEKFALRLVKVTLPILTACIRNGVAFSKLRRFRREKNPTEWELFQIRRDEQVAWELASDSLAVTLRRFQMAGQAGRGWGEWRPNGGANMTTWFVNGCILDFSNVYEKWRAKLPPPEVSFEEFEPNIGAFDDDDIPSTFRLLGDLTDEQIEILQLHFIDKWTHKEISELEEISIRASQGRLRRAKSRLRRIYGSENA